MPQHEIVAELFADLARRGVIRLVKSQGHAEFFESGPKRFVIGLVPVVAVDDIGAQKDCAKAQLLDAALGLSGSRPRC